VRLQNAGYLHEQSAAEQPGAGPVTGYFVEVRGPGEFFRATKSFFDSCEFARVNESFRAETLEQANPPVDTSRALCTLRFFVAYAKFPRIGGKSYKAREETTSPRGGPVFVTITKHAL
jgi:hypothetical protein